MNLIDELKENGVDLIERQPIIKCEVNEDAQIPSGKGRLGRRLSGNVQQEECRCESF